VHIADCEYLGDPTRWSARIEKDISASGGHGMEENSINWSYLRVFATVIFWDQSKKGITSDQGPNSQLPRVHDGWRDIP
jgi:hypothetical protein